MSETTDIVYKGTIKASAKLVQSMADDLTRSANMTDADKAIENLKPSVSGLMNGVVKNALKNGVDELGVLEAIHEGTLSAKSRDTK